MKTQDDAIKQYLTELLTPEQIEILARNNIPLTGKDGLRRYLAAKDIRAFLFIYFGHEFTADLSAAHYDMLEDIQAIRDRLVDGKEGIRLARAYPRGFGKSTYYSKILPIWGFLYGFSPLTVLIANNDIAARRLTMNIKDTIESNADIQEDFPDIHGESWGNERIQANNGAVITAYGITSGSLRGTSNKSNRPSIVLIDDADDDVSVRSMIQTATNVEVFGKAIMAMGDSVYDTTSYIAVGTIIRKLSLMTYILERPNFSSRVEKRIIRFSPNTALWEQWEQQYLDLAREGNQPKDASEDTFYQENKTALLQGTEVLWNKPDEYYKAMVWKLSHGEKAFNSEMQNTPVETDSTFGAVKYINIASIDERDYELLAVLDSTVHGNKNNDYASFVEVLFNRKRKEMIVSYADVEKRSYAATIDAVIKRIKARGRKYDAFWIEENSAGAVIKDLLTERLRQERLPLYPGGIYSKMPKNERINMLSEYISRSQLFITDTLPDEAKRELESWPITQHDDFLDSVSICVLKLKELGFIDLIQI